MSEKYIGAIFLGDNLEQKINMKIYDSTINEVIYNGEFTIPNNTQDSGDFIFQHKVNPEHKYNISFYSTDAIKFKHFFSKFIDEDTEINSNLIIRDFVKIKDTKNDLLYVQRLDDKISSLNFEEIYWADGLTNTFSFNAVNKRAKNFVAISVNGGLSWMYPSDSWALSYGSNSPMYNDKYLSNGHFAVVLKNTPASGEKIIIKWTPYCDTLSLFESINKPITDYGIEVS